MQRDRGDVPAPEPCELRQPDECANVLTHAIGFLLSVIGSFFLMRLALQGHPLAVVIACAVYCTSLVMLYLASTLSHAFYELKWRRFFRTLDQSSIYLLIAGSFTPFAVVYLWHGNWPVLLIVMWTFALLGIVLTIRLRNLPRRARWTYGIMGWLPIVALPNILDSAPAGVLLWVLAGGLFYSAGTLFLRLTLRVRYCHAAWHTFVIAGSACHYVAIWILLAQS